MQLNQRMAMQVVAGCSLYSPVSVVMTLLHCTSQHGGHGVKHAPSLPAAGWTQILQQSHGSYHVLCIGMAV
jgi:hypothetical protein